MPSDTITNPQLASGQSTAPRHPSSPGATTQAAVPLPSGPSHVHPASSQQSEQDVKHALQVAGPMPDSASVHKTVRKSRDSTAWWFTITAEEEYISRIDLHWAKISQNPKWVLLKSLKDRPHRPAGGTSSQVDESDLVTKDHRKSSEVSPTDQTEAATLQLSLTRPNCNSFLGAGNHHPPDPLPQLSYPFPS